MFEFPPIVPDFWEVFVCPVRTQPAIFEIAEETSSRKFEILSRVTTAKQKGNRGRFKQIASVIFSPFSFSCKSGASVIRRVRHLYNIEGKLQKIFSSYEKYFSFNFFYFTFSMMITLLCTMFYMILVLNSLLALSVFVILFLCLSIYPSPSFPPLPSHN